MILVIVVKLFDFLFFSKGVKLILCEKTIEKACERVWDT